VRKYGLKGLSLPDQRDGLFAYRAVFPAVEVPKVVSLICGPVADQADLGSCGAFAVLYNMVATAVQNDEEPLNLSQLFAYYAYREKYGSVASDDGVILRDLIKVIASVGVCLEDDWPYVLDNFADYPGKQNWQKAAGHKIKSYHAIYTVGDMIQCLASGYGFVGGISCYESFDSLETERTGFVRVPGIDEKFLGGHALYFGSGYDLHKGVIYFENSYGPTWGKKGFGSIPISYLTNPRLAGDFWAVRG
jgi:C1A family cysteine protease